MFTGQIFSHIPQPLQFSDVIKPFLTACAVDISDRYGVSSIVEDLKQEGALALIKATEKYEAAKGARFLTYAGAAVKTAMLDYAAENAAPVSVPPSRFIQLRRVSYIRADAPSDATEEQLTALVRQEMKVSEKVARELLLETGVLFGGVLLGDRVFDFSGGGNPAKIYYCKASRRYLHELMEKCLVPRELNLINRYCGFDDPDGGGMTFEQISVRTNFNSPSTAEKAFKNAVKKLTDSIPGSMYEYWDDINRIWR